VCSEASAVMGAVVAGSVHRSNASSARVVLMVQQDLPCSTCCHGVLYSSTRDAAFVVCIHWAKVNLYPPGNAV
jgi:hypothetical protein